MASEDPGRGETEGDRAGASSDSQVFISLRAQDRSLLQRIFPNNDIEKVAACLARLAFDEWFGWLAGTNRYITLTDQSIDRVINIFAQVMPDREPDVGFLYNAFNIPYGRARYIVQAIINKKLYELNTRALERLIQTLEAKLNEYKSLSQLERKTMQEIRFVVDPRAEVLLTTIIDQMPLDKRPVSSFKRIPSPLPSTREYSVDPRVLEPVLEFVKKYRDQIG